MNGVLILRKTEPQRLLQVLIDENIPIFISYLSDRKWQIARSIITGLTEKHFKVKITPQRAAKPVNLQPSLSVGITFQYGLEQGYGRFVFETTVESVEQAGDTGFLNSVCLAMPEEIEMIQRRSFMRVKVPKALVVQVFIRIQNFLTGVDGQHTPRLVKAGQEN